MVSAIAAAVAAICSAIAVFAANRSAKSMQQELEMSRASTKHQFAWAMEEKYSHEYPLLVKALGEWGDPVYVDGEKREVVHHCLQALTSIYLASQLNLIDSTYTAYLTRLYADWLSIPSAYAVWENVFRKQDGSWPDGFVGFVDASISLKMESS
jgi:hypothetical protein